ncbi:hypothetical protein B0J11DRAFT_520342, partial [Dendryphion nanum]
RRMDWSGSVAGPSLVGRSLFPSLPREKWPVASGRDTKQREGKGQARPPSARSSSAPPNRPNRPGKPVGKEHSASQTRAAQPQTGKGRAKGRQWAGSRGKGCQQQACPRGGGKRGRAVAAAKGPSSATPANEAKGGKWCGQGRCKGLSPSLLPPVTPSPPPPPLHSPFFPSHHHEAHLLETTLPPYVLDSRRTIWTGASG